MCSDRLRKVAGSLQIDWKKGLLNTKHRKQHETPPQEAIAISFLERILSSKVAIQQTCKMLSNTHTIRCTRHCFGLLCLFFFKVSLPAAAGARWKVVTTLRAHPMTPQHQRVAAERPSRVHTTQYITYSHGAHCRESRQQLTHAYCRRLCYS